MQDNQRSELQQSEHNVSPSQRIQRLLEHLDTQWKREHEPSPDDFKRLTEFVTTLPDPYKMQGLQTVAEHIVNGMSLHLLELLATFQEKALQEEISLKERDETLSELVPEVYQLLATLARGISVKSLDELVALHNITIPLYTLSKADTAEEAQTWLFELVDTYPRRLSKAGLLVAILQEQPKSSSFVHWMTYENQHTEKVEGVNIIISTIFAPSPNSISFGFERNQPPNMLVA